MKKPYYLLVGFLLLGLSACHKDDRPTVIQGLVTNSATGEPIADALINYATIVKNAAPGMGWRAQTSYTDANGFYSVTVPPNYNWDIYRLSKDGYLLKISPVMGHQFTFGEVNTLDIEMIPIDGFIRIVANNSIPGNDSLYVKFYSPITDAEFQLMGGSVAHTYPIKLSMNETYEEVIAFPGEDLIKIYWDSYNFFIFESTNRDSIYISRNDTLTYTIDF